MTSLKALLWFALAVLLASYAALLLRNGALNIDSNVLSLLPATEADPAVEQAFSNFSEQSTRSMVFLVVSADKTRAVAATDELGASLQALPGIAQVQWRNAATAQQDAARFYFDQRHHLLSRADAALLRAGDYQAFSDNSLSLALAPFAGELISLLPTDPFLLSYRAGSAGAVASGGKLLPDNGYLIANEEGKYHVLLRAELAQSPFNQELQQQLTSMLAVLEQRWLEGAESIQLLRMGAVFHAAYAYETASREIGLIGGCSFLLIVVLLVASFRSGWPVVMVTVALGFGIACGFIAVRLWFGEVHLLTLVFGSSLIGVAEDYAFHYFVIDDENSGEKRMARIFPPITTGLLSSVLGYAVLLLTPFPGLQQMAVFCICGLTGAWLTVIWLFPFIRLHNQNSQGMLRLCRLLLARLSGRTARRVFYATLPILVGTPLYLYLQGSTVDDVRSFQAQNAGLLAQQQAMEQVLAIPSSNQFYLVRGENEEELLANVETVQRQLDALVEQQVIDSYLSISDTLPSRARQDENHALLARLYDSAAADELVEAGVLSPEQLNAARAAFEQDVQTYLLPEQWLASLPGREYAYLWLRGDASDEAAPAHAALVALNGINTPEQLRDIEVNGELKGVFIDKVSTINQLLAVYRQNLSILICVAFAVIFALLWWRYDFRKAAFIASAPVIAIAASIAGMALLGEPFSLFSILSLFIIIGLGMDFGIFFAEEDELDPATLLAVLMSGLTTIFSFGMLSLSATAVIHSFGLSMLLGIGITLLLSPVIGNLIVKRTAQV